ncbi:hypothetical protein [Streptomyces sp. NPDC014733]|uniref:hypothetical protein n=1 Tax=Streptomyces sp. NPDC014733 TaxID=3364885 RepID=UPI0036FD2927
MRCHAKKRSACSVAVADFLFNEFVPARKERVPVVKGVVGVDEHIVCAPWVN